MAHQKDKLTQATTDFRTGDISILVKRYVHEIDEFGEEIQVAKNWRVVVKHGDVEALRPYLTEKQIEGVQEGWAKITPPEEEDEGNING